MSKAFTKEDQDAAGPIFRRRAPLPQGTPNYVTAQGLAALRDELARLDAAPSELAAADARAAWRTELELRIATAVVPEPPAARDEVRFGATVELQSAQARKQQVRIVGVDEANAARGLVAFTSPLARALLGRRVGDVVSVRAPGGDEELVVARVDYL